jgi:hypothetical protein
VVVQVATDVDDFLLLLQCDESNCADNLTTGGKSLTLTFANWGLLISWSDVTVQGRGAV